MADIFINLISNIRKKHEVSGGKWSLLVLLPFGSRHIIAHIGRFSVFLVEETFCFGVCGLFHEL